MDYLPVRPLLKASDDDGAWIVAKKASERKRFKAIICALNETKDQLGYVEANSKMQSSDRNRQFNTQYIFDLCCTVDPSKIAAINVNMHELESSADSYEQFESVYKIEANGNKLLLESFHTFPNLQVLHLAGNNISTIFPEEEDLLDKFSLLTDLDISYNNIRKEDLKKLSSLIGLKCLNLAGNNLNNLPNDFMMLPNGDNGFDNLEELDISRNSISTPETFAILASLKKLKYLNISNNFFNSLPLLKFNELKALQKQHDLEKTSSIRSSLYDHDELEMEEEYLDNYEMFSSDNTIYKSNFLGLRIPSTLPEVEEETTGRSIKNESDTAKSSKFPLSSERSFFENNEVSKFKEELNEEGHTKKEASEENNVQNIFHDNNGEKYQENTVKPLEQENTQIGNQNKPEKVEEEENAQEQSKAEENKDELSRLDENTQEQEDNRQEKARQEENTEEQNEISQEQTGKEENTEKQQEFGQEQTRQEENTEQQQEFGQEQTGQEENSEEQKEIVQEQTGNKENTEEQKEISQEQTGQEENTEEQKENNQGQIEQKESSDEQGELTEQQVRLEENTQEQYEINQEERDSEKNEQKQNNQNHNVEEEMIEESHIDNKIEKNKAEPDTQANEQNQKKEEVDNNEINNFDDNQPNENVLEVKEEDVNEQKEDSVKIEEVKDKRSKYQPNSELKGKNESDLATQNEEKPPESNDIQEKPETYTAINQSNFPMNINQYKRENTTIGFQQDFTMDRSGTYLELNIKSVPLKNKPVESSKIPFNRQMSHIEGVNTKLPKMNREMTNIQEIAENYDEDETERLSSQMKDNPSANDDEAAIEDCPNDFTVISQSKTSSITEVIRFVSELGSNDAKYQYSDYHFFLPFPALEKLDISHNNISSERVLIPVIAWMNLKTLHVHNNPLTLTKTQKSSFIKALLEKTFKIQVDWLEPIPKKSHWPIEINTSKIKTLDVLNPKVTNKRPKFVDEQIQLGLPDKLGSLKSSKDLQVVENGLVQENPDFSVQLPRQKTVMEIIRKVEKDLRNVSDEHNQMVPLQKSNLEIENLLVNEDKDTNHKRNRESAIRSLRFKLDHPITYFERNVELYYKQKTLKPIKKSSCRNGQKKVKKPSNSEILGKIPRNQYQTELLLHEAVRTKDKDSLLPPNLTKDAQKELEMMQNKYDKLREQGL